MTPGILCPTIVAVQTTVHAIADGLTPSTAPSMCMLADLAPRTLALMHGPSFTGDCAGALRDLADAYAARFTLAATSTGA